MQEKRTPAKEFFSYFFLFYTRFFGLTGVEMCQAVSDVCALTMSIPIGMSVIREMRNIS